MLIKGSSPLGSDNGFNGKESYLHEIIGAFMMTSFKKKALSFIERSIPDTSHGFSISIDRDQENILTCGMGEIRELDFKYDVDTIYDFASLTKPLVTTTLVLRYLENGIIGLEDTLGSLGLFEEPEAASRLTVRSLITHTSGLQADFPLYRYGNDRESYTRLIGTLAQRAVTNTQEEYSDLNFILLGFMLEQISGKTLDRLAMEEIFRPLGMKNTSFNPNFPKSAIAPTEQTDDRGLVWGAVHDEKAYHNNGVAGHAGLFSNLSDTRKLILSLLHGEILSKSTVNLMWKPQTTYLNGTYGLGWIVKQPRPANPSMAFGYSYFLGDYSPMGTVGHTGFTGPSISIDPESGIFVIILCNRVYPTRENINILRFRRLFHNLVYGNLYNTNVD